MVSRPFGTECLAGCEVVAGGSAWAVASGALLSFEFRGPLSGDNGLSGGFGATWLAYARGSEVVGGFGAFLWLGRASGR